MKKYQLEDVYEEIESKEVHLESLDYLAASAYELNTLESKDLEIVRIEGDASFLWSGVTGCNNNDRVQGELQKVMDQWAKDRIFEHRNWRWTKYGAISTHGRCYQRRDQWTGVRDCDCRGYLKCYIEFRKL
jgi:hypothetical protein